MNRIAALVEAAIDGGEAGADILAASRVPHRHRHVRDHRDHGGRRARRRTGRTGRRGAVGIAIARNEIANQVATRIADATVETTGDVTLESTESATITAITAAAAAAGSAGGIAISFAGAGANARNVILTRTTATIEDSDVDGDAVSLTATSTGTTIDALVAGISAAISAGLGADAAAIGVAVAENYIGWDPHPAGTTDLTTDSTTGSVTNGKTVMIASGSAKGDIYKYVGTTAIPAANLKTQDYTDTSKWQQLGTTAAGETTAAITDSDVDATTLALTATSSETITAEVEAASVALAGGGVAVAAAAAGVYVANRIGQATRATISGGTITVDGDGTTAITLEAEDTSTITATGGAASVAAAFGFSGSYSAAIAGAIARNDIAAEVAAFISGATVTTTSGLTSLSATNSADIDATSTAAALSVSLSGASLAGGGASEDVSITTTTTAYLSGGSFNLGGGLDLAASDTSTAAATVVTAAVAIGFAAAGSRATVTVSPTTQAWVSDATLIAAGPVSIFATEKARAFATANGNAYGLGIAAAGSAASATLGATVSARVIGGSVTTTSGDITLIALHNSGTDGVSASTISEPLGVKATAKSSSGALVGAITTSATAVSQALVEASVASGTTLDSASAITLIAAGWAAPTASVIGTAGGVAGLGNASATATAKDSVLAHMGGTVVAATGLTVTARGTEEAKATAETSSYGGYAAGSATATATVEPYDATHPSAKASLGNGDVTVTGAIALLSVLAAAATAKADGASYGGVAVGLETATATFAPRVETSIAVGTISGNTISLTALLNATETGGDVATTGATATVGASSGGALALGDTHTATATDTSLVDTHVDGGTLSATGAITLLSAQYGAPTASGKGFAAGLVGLGKITATATSKASVQARMLGSVAAGTSLGVMALSTQLPVADAQNLTAGIVAVGGATATAGVQQNGTAPNAKAALGSGAISVTNSVSVITELRSGPSASAKGADYGLAADRKSTSSATSSPRVEATIAGGSVTATNGGITLEARLNVDGSASWTGDMVTASSDASAVGAGANSSPTSTASSTPTVEVTAGGLLTAGTDVLIRANAVTRASATSKGMQAGLVSIGAATATATTGGSVKAHLDGSVGTATTTGADNVIVAAVSSENAAARAEALSGGIVGATSNESTATVNPTVQAWLGNSALVHVRTNVDVTATETPEGDAFTKGRAYGGAAAGNSLSSLTLAPAVTAYTGTNTLVTAPGGTVTVLARTMWAAGTAPDYTIKSVNITTDEVTVTGHGLATGDTVQYSPATGTTALTGLRTTMVIEGDEDNPVARLYNVVSVGTDVLLFGSQFTAAACAAGSTSCVNATADTIYFAAPHYFSTGDMVRYSADGGTAVGLTENTQAYYVIVVDSRTIRLTTVDPTTATFERDFTPANIDATDYILMGNHGLAGAVTYHAPQPTQFSSGQVNVSIATRADGSLYFTDNPGANNIGFVNADGAPVAHGFTDGEKVVYTLTSYDSNPAVGLGLSGTITYRVVTTSDNRLFQLKYNDVTTQAVRFTRATGGGIVVADNVDFRWADAGFASGQTVIITGSSINNGTYNISSVSNNRMTLSGGTAFTATLIENTALDLHRWLGHHQRQDHKVERLGRHRCHEQHEHHRHRRRSRHDLPCQLGQQQRRHPQHHRRHLQRIRHQRHRADGSPDEDLR